MGTAAAHPACRNRVPHACAAARPPERTAQAAESTPPPAALVRFLLRDSGSQRPAPDQAAQRPRRAQQQRRPPLARHPARRCRTRRVALAFLVRRLVCRLGGVRRLWHRRPQHRRQEVREGKWLLRDARMEAAAGQRRGQRAEGSFWPHRPREHLRQACELSSKGRLHARVEGQAGRAERPACHSLQSEGPACPPFQPTAMAHNDQQLRRRPVRLAVRQPSAPPTRFATRALHLRPRTVFICGTARACPQCERSDRV